MLHTHFRRCVWALVPILVVALGVSPSMTIAAPPDIANRPHSDPASFGCGKAHALSGRFRPQQVHEQTEERSTKEQNEAGPREAFDETDLLHCDLDIEVIPGSSNNIYGTNVMTIQSKSSSLTEFTLRLRSQFIIDSADVDGTSVVVSVVDTSTRQVTLDRAYGMDEVFTLTIVYHGHAESRGFGSIEFTNHGGFGTDIVYTLSESYYAYTWWPIKDGDFGVPGDNGDQFTLDIAITAPDWMVTASNGLLQGTDPLSGNRMRTRWSSNYPIAPYLVCFSSTDYNTWQLNYTPIGGGAMPVLFYIYPEDDTPANRSAWEEVVQMMYTLRDLYGEYPFVDEKYGIYECQFGGGMEHQTFTAQGTFNEWVTVHELGHQWWGDMITCKTWNHIWLNEGFASYTEALWAEFKPGSSGLPALKSYMTGMRYTGAGSIYVSDAECGSLYDIFDGNTTYDKAGWVVHMMRHVLGNDDFFDALAAYRAAFEGGAATTEDFQDICEGFYPGGDLDWFFQEWIYGERTPSYQYGYQSVNVNGQDYLAIYIDQTQSTSYQRFSMPIDIVVDGVTHVVFNDNDPEHFLLPIAAPASSVSFDPDEWILRGSASLTSYVPGPPKIVETSPQPGESVACGTDLDTVTITFHTNVSTSAGNYALVGTTTGPQSMSFAYDSGANTVTLTSAGPLPADEYTLTVDDALTAINSGANLDGEIADPISPTSLPSGEGLAGGDAVIQFTVQAAPLGDIDGDCDRDMTDVAFFVDVLLGIQQAEPYVSNSNIDGIGGVNGLDIQPFVDALMD